MAEARAMPEQSDAVAGAAQPTTTTTIASDMPSTTAPSDMPTPVSPLTATEDFKDAVQEQRDSEPVSAVSAPSPLEPATQPPPAASSSQQPPTITRKQTEALGPATEGPIGPPAPNTSTGPTLNISLLLQNGNRHPYKIDEKYLRNRKVEARNSATGAFDPKEISGYQLKELIWTDWRSEWEPRPASPSSIRLIHMGKLIEDKSALKDARFNMDGSNVVHMTVKPAELENDDETGGKSSSKSGVLRTRDTEERGAGCRCIIM